jgi:hypothetical protein
MREGLVDAAVRPGRPRRPPRRLSSPAGPGRRPAAPLIPRQTVNGLARRRLLRLAKDAPAVLTLPGRKLAEQLAAKRRTPPTESVMNAHTPAPAPRRAACITDAVVKNIPLLRLVASAERPKTKGAFAELAGKDASNANRAMKLLAEDGVVEGWEDYPPCASPRSASGSSPAST